MSGKSELYIGVPNGIVLCMDEPIRAGLFRARLYHGYRDGAIEIISFEELIHVMGRLFDELQFPRASIRERSFFAEPVRHQPINKRKERIMADKDLLAKHGDIGTFIIRVQQRQNSTWQGRITWVNEDKTMRFRSILEMIKLIESGIYFEYPELVDEDEVQWDV